LYASMLSVCLSELKVELYARAKRYDTHIDRA
jgi:hypothetical protein